MQIFSETKHCEKIFYFLKKIYIISKNSEILAFLCCFQ